jgi:hypothetical protein
MPECAGAAPLSPAVLFLVASAKRIPITSILWDNSGDRPQKPQLHPSTEIENARARCSDLLRPTAMSEKGNAMYYVINSSNSINNTTDNLFGSARTIGGGENLLVTSTGYVLATGTGSTGVYVNGYATNSIVRVDGLVMGSDTGIYSLGSSAQIDVNGQVAGGYTGVSIANGGRLHVGAGGSVSGAEGVALLGSTLINDGTVTGTGNDAIQFAGGTIINNGLISSSYTSIFFGADAAGRITNTGTIQGGLSTWYAASDPAANLQIDNSGIWHGSLDLTPGDDTVDNTGSIFGDISLGAGNDVYDGRYGQLSGSISTGDGNDIIRAGSEDDVIDGGAGADTIRGGGGNNTVSYQSSAGWVKIDLLAGIAQYGDAAGDHLYNIQNITGSLKSDILIGDNKDNELNGVLGKDRLIGNGGNDTLTMLGAGPAIIDGGSGNDLMQFISAAPGTYGYAFSAACKVDGGTGYDTVELTNTGSVVLKDTTLVNVERIAVMDGFDYSLKTADANVASGKLLAVDAGALGDAFKLNFNGSAETDGRFQLDGGAGEDTLKAGGGADLIAGYGGADVLTGGGGADTFIFTDITDSPYTTHDRITDFKAGTDKLQFDFKVTGIDTAVSGSVSTDVDLAGLLSGHLEAHHAILVDVTSGMLTGQKLLVVDGDGVDGFNAATDYVIDVKGISGTLTVADFMV